MPNNWKTYKLGNVAKIIDSLHKTPKYSIDGFPMIRAQDIIGGNIDIENTVKVSENIYNDFSKNHKTKSGDLVFSRVGAHCGKVSYVNTNVPFCLGQNTVFIIPENCSCKFIYYLLSSEFIQEELNKSAVVSTYKTISLQTLRNLNINIPNIDEQQSISSILTAIDDKIENNLAINKTLEEMAMALYKHWFVDFGPFQDGEFVESELGLIPKGWEVRSIYDACEVIYGAPFKSKLFNENAIGYPLIRIRDLKTNKPQYYTQENHPKKTIIKAGDVVAGMDAEFDPYYWLGEEGVLNQRLVLFKPKKNISKVYLYNSVLPSLKFYAGAKVGTTVIHLGKSDLDRFKIILPTDIEILKDFNFKTDDMLEQIVNNSKENKSLSKLRDTLLPKLISGEVRLKEFQ